MASNPLFISNAGLNVAMSTLGLKEMGKFLCEGREKKLPSWLSQFSFAKLRQPKGQTFFPTFAKEFSHFLDTKESHSWVLLENAKKNLVFYFEGWRHASFPQKPVVKSISYVLPLCTVSAFPIRNHAFYPNLQNWYLLIESSEQLKIKMGRSKIQKTPRKTSSPKRSRKNR